MFISKTTITITTVKSFPIVDAKDAKYLNTGWDIKYGRRRTTMMKIVVVGSSDGYKVAFWCVELIYNLNKSGFSETSIQSLKYNEKYSHRV